jgi:tetratricopeptide (TPR) repeat protein
MMARLLLLCCTVLSSSTWASFADSFTAEEKTLLKEIDAGHFIKARKAAETLLSTNPRSFPAMWAMARVHHDEEGNHARALYYLDKAQTLLADRDAEWGKQLLLEQYDVTFEMARNQEALEVLAKYEARFGPPPPHLKIWPLFKTGRIEEAREVALRLTGSKDPFERVNGYNSLLSIAFEQRDRFGAHQWALDGVRATNEQSCTILMNAGGTAFTNFRLSDAERLLLKADKASDCSSTPYDQLATLALLRGEPQKALSALQTARTKPLQKRYRPQFALIRREVLCDLLGVLGKEEEAAKLASELFRQPARTGMTSAPQRVERMRRTLRSNYALDGLLRRLEEKASFGPAATGLVRTAPDLAEHTATRWEHRRALVRLLVEEDFLRLVMRPNLSDIGDFPAWRTPDLIDILGGGVWKTALDEARSLDAKSPGATAYYDAFEAEFRLRSGQPVEAIRLAEAALQGLPKEEALIHWRLTAVFAESLTALNRKADARPHWSRLMREWPTIIRILDLRLPVSISHDGSTVGSAIASRLKRSKRFREDASAPHSIQIEAAGKGALVCLTEGTQARLTCATEETPDAVLEKFHADAFSPKISLTDADMRGLDGSPIRVSADEALKQVLTP